MKRIALFLALFLLLALPVQASTANNIKSETAIDPEGECTVTVNLTVTFDEAVSHPVYPIPEGAQNVTLNGGAVHPQDHAVSLKGVTGGMAGTYSLSVGYTLPGTVAADEETEELVLTLPLLSGFAYPIEKFEFTVNLPGKYDSKPQFVSDYYHTEAASLLELTYTDTAISGTTRQPLKDHESMTMTMAVDEDLFPQTAAEVRVMNLMDAAVIGAALLAIIYFLLALRPMWPNRISRSTAPDGVCPGDCAGWLTGRGMDLTLLVVTWAQLGYLRIQIDDNGRVLLHKRMDMGNERSAFENRVFRSLFGRRQTVDGTGYHYGELCRSVAKQRPQNKNVYDRRSGNPWIFRGLAAVSGLLSGIAVAGALVPHSTFLKVLLAALAAAASFAIQTGGTYLPLRNKVPVYVALGATAVWLILGIWSGEWLMSCLMLAFQWLCGLGVAYGGRRTVLGQQALEQILALRRHMRRVGKGELQRILKSNPGYFHDLAPYALAMGMERTFAKRFGRLRLPECTYLRGTVSTQLSAAEWTEQLRQAANILDARAKRLPFERLMMK